MNFYTIFNFFYIDLYIGLPSALLPLAGKYSFWWISLSGCLTGQVVYERGDTTVYKHNTSYLSKHLSIARVLSSGLRNAK